jgi:hypothetical protein
MQEWIWKLVFLHKSGIPSVLVSLPWRIANQSSRVEEGGFTGEYFSNPKKGPSYVFNAINWTLIFTGRYNKYKIRGRKFLQF